MPVLKERRCKELQDTDIHQTPVYYALGSKAESMGSVHSDREARRLGAREAAGGKENMQILPVLSGCPGKEQSTEGKSRSLISGKQEFFQ